MRALGTLLHRTSTLAFCEASVFDGGGQLCAHATGTFKYLRALPSSKGGEAAARQFPTIGVNMATINKRFVLASRPTGEPSAQNFRLEEAPLPTLQDGEVLVRHHYLSLDPYMRGRMSEGKSYAQPQPLNAVMVGGTVGEVVESRHAGYKAGRQGGRHGRLAAVRGGRRAQPGVLRKVDTIARADLGLPRRGRHARRHGLGTA